jgi:hypothetical protein
MLVMIGMGVREVWRLHVVNNGCHGDRYRAPILVLSAHDVRICGMGGKVRASTKPERRLLKLDEQEIWRGSWDGVEICCSTDERHEKLKEIFDLHRDT